MRRVNDDGYLQGYLSIIKFVLDACNFLSKYTEDSELSPYKFHSVGQRVCLEPANINIEDLTRVVISMSVRFCLSYGGFKWGFIALKDDIISIENITLSRTAS